MSDMSENNFKEFIMQAPIPQSSRSSEHSYEVDKCQRILDQNKKWVQKLLELIDRLSHKFTEQTLVMKSQGVYH